MSSANIDAHNLACFDSSCRLRSRAEIAVLRRVALFSILPLFLSTVSHAQNLDISGDISTGATQPTAPANAPLSIIRPPPVQPPPTVQPSRSLQPRPTSRRSTSSSQKKEKDLHEGSAGDFASADPVTLKNNQAVRDTLFSQLKASSTQYTFEYVVINLSPGTLPGISASIPVSHVRYRDTAFFAFDSFVMESSAQAVVMDFAKTILQDKSYRSILVVGHTDSVGGDDYNFNLSKNRAATVATALRAAGIKDDFLGVVPMGKSQPLTSNSTPAGQAINRRVEFFISDFPAAARAAIEQIKFNPCDLNDHLTDENQGCAQGPTRIPIFRSSGQGRPLKMLHLSRNAIPPASPTFREPLPQEPLQRPSIKELQQ
jgi:outer membrane protein OmpA-like peptidoglycan-associated protein